MDYFEELVLSANWHMLNIQLTPFTRRESWDTQHYQIGSLHYESDGKFNDLLVILLTRFPLKDSLQQVLERHVEVERWGTPVQALALISGVKTMNKAMTTGKKREVKIGTSEVIALLTAMGFRLSVRLIDDTKRSIDISVASAIDFLYGNTLEVLKQDDGHQVFTDGSSNSNFTLSSRKNISDEDLLCDPTIRPVIKRFKTISSTASLQSESLQRQDYQIWARKQNIQGWVKYLLEKEGIIPNEVKSTNEYPEEFDLEYNRNEGESNPNNFIEFIITKFGLMYKIAETLLQLVEAETADIDTNRFGNLSQWANTAYLGMGPFETWLLPLVDALSENPRKSPLTFRRPMARSGNPDSIYLHPIAGVTKQATEVIINTVYERASIEELGTYALSMLRSRDRMLSRLSDAELGALYFLRSRDEMLHRLLDLSKEEREAIKDLDFLNYLKSVGYPYTDFEQLEYKGYLGLLKAIEIQSLSHLWDWPCGVDWLEKNS